MDDVGYRWSISPEPSGAWRWAIISRDRGEIVLGGLANSRAVAAAHVVRAIAMGMTHMETEAGSLAA